MARFSLLFALAAAGSLAAQTSLTTTVEKRIEVTAAGPARERYFAAIEAVDTRPVKGAPFSARAVTESVRVLADGTRIVQKAEAGLWRDREGRTRREFVPATVGEAPSGEQPPATVVLYDPGAGAVWLLDPAEKAARKIRVIVEGSVEAAAGEERRELVFPAPTLSMWAERRLGPAAGSEFGGAFSGARLLRFAEDAREEDLGERVIEGLAARGTRFTQVIPKGRIGNDRPITIVHERWVAPELSLVVLAETRDPLSGDLTYRLTEIRRGDPPAGLFEVPADYKVEEAGRIERRFRLVEETEKSRR
jgi:hypothetical protein